VQLNVARSSGFEVPCQNYLNVGTHYPVAVPRVQRHHQSSYAAFQLSLSRFCCCWWVLNLMQDDSKEDTKADESDDDLADLQDAIHASLRASFGQVPQYLRSGMTGENVASDEATTRVEHLHEHASLDIVREGVLNARVDSDQGMTSHELFHLENYEPHDLHGDYFAFLGGPVSTS
jgi:hypothetical protein